VSILRRSRPGSTRCSPAGETPRLDVEAQSASPTSVLLSADRAIAGREEAAPGGLPELPPWPGPAALETRAVLAVERTMARSANVVVLMPTIRAVPPGCTLDVARLQAGHVVRGRLAGPAHVGVWRPPRKARRARLPDRLLRLGVRYSDGTKATTIEAHRRRTLPSDDPRPARCCPGHRAAATAPGAAMKRSASATSDWRACLRTTSPCLADDAG
jgi:hypothetical protein